MFTLYARYEPTTDWLTLKYCDEPLSARTHDLALYHDADCTKPAGRYPWHVSRPDRRNRYVMHNCSRYHLEFVH